MKCLAVITLLVSSFGLGTPSPARSSPLVYSQQQSSIQANLRSQFAPSSNLDGAIVTIPGDDGHTKEDPNGDGDDKSLEVFEYPHGDSAVSIVHTSHYERTISAGGGYTIQDYTIQVEMAVKDDGSVQVYILIHVLF